MEAKKRDGQTVCIAAKSEYPSSKASRQQYTNKRCISAWSAAEAAAAAAGQEEQKLNI